MKTDPIRTKIHRVFRPRSRTKWNLNCAPCATEARAKGLRVARMTVAQVHAAYETPRTVDEPAVCSNCGVDMLPRSD
jgi:hypothetical protein